jgi:two-component system, OmpR family, sensor kinase
MGKLSVRLALAFALVTIVAVLVVAIAANRQFATEVRRFLVYDQVRASPLVATLADFYATHDSWDGVEQVAGDARLPMGMGRGMGGAAMLVIADSAGDVVYDATGRLTARLSRAELAEALPIEVGGRTAGYLLAIPPGRAEMSASEQRLMSRINRSLLLSGLLAGGIGVALGLALSRGITAPLGRLAAATHRVARGHLDERVPERGSAEMIDVARSFNAMAADLERAEQQRRDMVADIAHELRTPLSVVQGNLQAILDDLYPLDKREIAAIHDETRTLSRLINDLHDLALADAGRLSLHPESLEVGPLVDQMVAFLADHAAEHGVALSAAMAPELPPALADRDRLRQIISNLLINALRYTQPGGHVTVEVARDSQQGDRLRVAVRDTGPGIAPEDLPQVFDRFWRADRSRSRALGGSGLGLAIARQLVEAHGGTIGVESAPGQGSTFWFTLPLATR